LRDHGRPRLPQGVRHRQPRRARQHRGRYPRRLLPRGHGGTRRRLRVLGLPRCHGLPADHRHSADQAHRALRAQGPGRLMRLLTAAWVLLLASVPLWLSDLYVLHVLIITAIFIIAAMSLNLLLGYAGQLSLGHAAFFGIGADAWSLISLGIDVHLLPDWRLHLAPQPVWFAMFAAVAAAGACGWMIGRLSFRVRGAYFVIVTVSFAEVVHLVALNWVEL